MADVLILIPARKAATRLPGKPLADIGGEPMIVHVLRRALAAAIGPVAVATDSAEIAAVVDKAGGTAVMTRSDHASGSDRICEALGLRDYFFQIYGGNSFGTKKPDPEGLRALMAEAGAKPQETVMVGDSVVDVLTARNAGTNVIGCSFGLSSHTLETVISDCMVDAPLEWAAALGVAVER